MPFAADLIGQKILVFGKRQVVAFACFFVVNHFIPVQGGSELHTGNILLLQAVRVDAKREQLIVGGIKAQAAADQFIFRLIAVPVGPFETGGFTDRVEPIVGVGFIRDFEGVQGDDVSLWLPEFPPGLSFNQGNFFFSCIA